MPCADYIVYVVDPDEAVHDAISALLIASGMQVMCFSNAEEFLDTNYVDKCECGCLLTEANLPGMGSLALLRQLRDRHIDIPTVVLASTSNRDIADQVLKAGALEVIEKPLASARLVELLRELAASTNEFVNTIQ